MTLQIPTREITTTASSRHHSNKVCRLMLSQTNDNDDDMDDQELSSKNDEVVSQKNSLFQQRKQSYERSMAKGIWQRPPNPFLSPEDFVRGLLRELRDPHDSLSGYRCLLESSTPEWRKILFGSVGASSEADHDGVAVAVGATNTEVAASLKGLFQKKDNQFGILVGVEDQDHVLDLPSQIDFLDGTSWVECRFSDQTNHELLVVTGWSLKQRDLDGAWQLDKLEWQDFRDKYRPGIGREEWERICG